MGNLGATLKRFIANKNTVTIIAVLAGVIVLWYFYNYRVNQAITTIKIPYSVVKIDTGKKIEADNILYKEITATTLKDSDMITDINQIVGKYVCTGTSIPQNGFFYQSQVCEEKEISNSFLERIQDGYTLYQLKVNNETTYANSILPDSYIDLYMQAIDDDRNVVFGPLIESIQVYAVRDSSGKDVFWDSDAGDSAYLIFAVPNNYFKLLTVSGLVQSYSIRLTPVPRGTSYTQNPGETKITSVEMCQFIVRNAAEFTDVEGIDCNE